MAVLGNEITTEQKRRGLEYAERVAALALDAPDDLTRRFAYVAANSIRKIYGFSRDEKKDEIFRRICIGASTISDLINETGFHRDDIHELTRELEAEKLVICRRLSTTGGNGRPAICFFPVENTPFAPQKIK